MQLPNHFSKFLREIRPTDTQKNNCKQGHRTLRERLHADADLDPIIVNTFLQGSYRRSTAVRPQGHEARLDVDVIVVTRLRREDYPAPDDAMDLFVPFLDKFYKGKHQRQGRSFAIELSTVDLDLVITSAPSEAEEKVTLLEAVATDAELEEVPDWRLVKSWVAPDHRNIVFSEVLMAEARRETEWKSEPLWIPDRDAAEWKHTHPLEQYRWTLGKNARCGRHFVNVVKALKWWRDRNYPDDRPKGYPLEHLIGVYCPDKIDGVDVGVVYALEAFVEAHRLDVLLGSKPNFSDHGVPEHDVFARVSAEQFKTFYGHAADAAKTARMALDAKKASESAERWRDLFGTKFPPAEDDEGDNGGARGPFIAPGVRTATGDLTPRKYGR